MRKLALIALAAGTALIPAAAAAQPAPAPGVSWGGQRGAPPNVRHRGDPRVVVPHRGRDPRVVVRGGGFGGGGHFRTRFPHVTRIVRGHRVPHFWFGPQFHVRNWQVYGFPQPRRDWRWVRYYDDALLIDRGGVVHDGRYGFDWDRYGESWGYDDRGIPVYAGRGDVHRGGEGYGWADEEEAGWDMSEYDERHYRDERGYGHGGGHARGGGYGGGYGHPGPGPGYPPPMPAPGYGHGGYGYGATHGYGAATITETITETFVHTAPTGYVEEVIEEVVETRRPQRRVRRPRVRCHCPPPPPRRPAPPPAGERG